MGPLNMMRATGLLLAGAACLVALAAPLHSSEAVSQSKPLDKSYFFGLAYSCGDCWPNSISIAGEKFTGTSINLWHLGDHVSLNARNLSGYNAVAFKIGCSDGSSVGTSATVKVLGDTAMTPIAKFTAAQGQPARLEIVPFNGHGTLNFVKLVPASYSKDCEFVIANPAAIVLGPPAAGALTISSPTIAAGGQETITVAARPATQATVVVTYASGAQQVVGPTSVAASGRLSVTFTVAQGVHGRARVTAVTATGDLHGAFTVTG